MDDFVITQEQIDQYKRDGAICIRRAVAQEWIEKMLPQLDAHFENGGDPETVENGELAYSDRYLYKKHAWMNDFVFNSGVAAIAGRLMESSLASVYFDHIFIREGGTRETTPWHQDRPYWPFLGKQIASVWVAFSASDQSSSAMSFIKGSHQWDKAYKPQAFSEADANDEWIMNAKGETIPDFWNDNEGLELLSWATEPGDVIVFGGDILHAAGVNQATSGRRVAISTRFLGDDSIWDPRVGTDPIITQEHVSINPGDIAIADKQSFPIAWQR